MAEQPPGVSLIDEARAALSSAQEAIARLQSQLGSTGPIQTGERDVPEPSEAQEPASHAELEAAQRERERQERIAAIAAELAALNVDALEQLRVEAEAVLARYVTAAVVYNRILGGLREELRALGAGEVAELDYRDASGRPGLRVHDVVRPLARPWQTVSRLAWTVLTTHAPAPQMSLDAPHDLGFDELPMSAPPQTECARSHPELRATRAEPVVDTLPEPEDGIETGFDVADSLASGRGAAPPGAPELPAPLEEASTDAVIAEHSQEIAQLHAQLAQQAEIVSQLASYLEYLSALYQDRLKPSSLSSLGSRQDALLGQR